MLVIAGLVGAEQEDLRVEVLEDELEVVLVADLDDALETEGCCLLEELEELLGLVVCGEDDGVGRSFGGGRGATARTRAAGARRPTRTPSTSPRRTRPSAPSPAASRASSQSRTSTRIEIPSPSEIAWLRRREPLTARIVTAASASRDTTRHDRADSRGDRPGAGADPGSDAGSGQARAPAGCGVDGEVDARGRARGGVRDALEPRVRTPLHGDRAGPRSAVDERGVHAHRADHLLVRGLPRALRTATCCSATRTRSRPRSSTRSTWAPRPPPSPTSCSRPYDLTVVCGLDVPWSHDGVREFEEQRLWMHERYVEHARESGRPWLLVEGSREQRLADARAAVDALLAAAGMSTSRSA